MDQLSRSQHAEESFASVAEYAPAMLWRGDALGKCVYLNRAQRQFWGVEDIARFSWASTLLDEDAPLVFGPFSEGMANRQPFECEGRYRRADGAIRILHTNAQPHFTPDGEFTGMIGVNVDVTDERRAQAELRESEARLRALADNIPYGMVFQLVVEPGGARRFSFVSNRCRQLNGVSPEDALADPELLYGCVAPEERERFADAEALAMRELRPFDIEVPMQTPDGVRRWFRISSAPRKLGDGRVVWDGVQVDIHDVKMAEERRRLLMREMSHRIKNNLATVLSIAVQSGRAAVSYRSFLDVFQARLQALAQSHDLLMRAEQDSALLHEILEHALKPYGAEHAGGRTLRLLGDPVRVSGRAAIGLALVAHELATNAAKYGAYAMNGAVEVAWQRLGDERVRLQWRERGGPRPKEPTRSGFGSTLIDSIICSDLRGAIERRYAAAGFEADIDFSTVSAGD